MVNDVKGDILRRINKSEPCELKALTYTSRSVRGGNFCIKVSVANSEVIHVKINIMPQAILCGVRTDVNNDTPIQLFDDN
jgi:hypothetical protein